MGITNPGEQYFKDGTWGWNGTAWVKAGVLLAYKGQVLEQVYVANAAAGANVLRASAVPVGELWVVTAMFALNITSATTSTNLGFQSGATDIGFAGTGALLAGVGFSWSGHLYLVAGQKPMCSVGGCTLNDDLYFTCNGYKVGLT